METADCVVIGAGVVGLAVARAFARAGREVLILESASEFGTGTSSRNSEVIHAGIFYDHGSLKERLCVEGRDKLYSFCDAYGVNYKRTTKLVYANDESEIPELKRLQKHADESGVYMTLLSKADVSHLEPHLRCAAALHSPLTGVVDSHGFMLALLGDAESNGAVVAYNSPVKGGRGTDGDLELEIGGTTPMTLRARTVINCAGLFATSVSTNIAGVPTDTIPKLHYAKGNYFYLNGKTPFKRLIYPLPQLTSLGIHYSVDLSGQGRFGPDIEYVNDIDYTVDENLADKFYAAIREYWPDLPDGALRPGYSGIRPKLQGPKDPRCDFVIQGPDITSVNGYIALYGIESPGLTSSLAIADTLVERLS